MPAAHASAISDPAKPLTKPIRFRALNPGSSSRSRRATDAASTSRPASASAETRKAKSVLNRGLACVALARNAADLGIKLLRRGVASLPTEVREFRRSVTVDWNRSPPLATPRYLSGRAVKAAASNDPFRLVPDAGSGAQRWWSLRPYPPFSASTKACASAESHLAPPSTAATSQPSLSMTSVTGSPSALPALRSVSKASPLGSA